MHDTFKVIQTSFINKYRFMERRVSQHLPKELKNAGNTSSTITTVVVSQSIGMYISAD